MRKLLALILLFITISVPAFAQQCSIDKASGGFPKCPVGDLKNPSDPVSNPLLNFPGAHLESDVRLSETPIYRHDLCRYTDARGISPGENFLIPFNTPADWQGFISSHSSAVDVVQCCTPRSLKVSDVPEPSESCAGAGGTEGYWALDALVDPADSSVIIARPSFAGSSSAPLVLVAGAAESADYPITEMPVARDNSGATFPTVNSGTIAAKKDIYLARYICSLGRKPVGLSSHSVPSSVVPSSAIGEVRFVQFRLQCRTGNWTGITPDFCETTSSGGDVQVGPNYQTACATGQTGVITNRIVRKCQSFNSTVATGGVVKISNLVPEVVSNTCEQCARTENRPDETEACPAGQTGLITYSVVRTWVVSGGACVYTDQRTLKSNTCSSCAREELIRTEKEACSAGQSGEKTYEVYKVYYLDGTQCLSREDRRLKSDTCAPCVREELLRTEREACAAGQSGEKVYEVYKVYSVDPVTKQCVSREDRRLKSNTCSGCARTEDLPDEVKQCPTGQSGQIVYTVKKIYYLDGTQCKFRIEKTLKSNTCKPICDCTPSVRYEYKDCGAGYTGQVKVRIEHICDGSHDGHGRDVITEDRSQCKPVNVCRPFEDLGTEKRACPTGQAGEIVVRLIKRCQPDPFVYGAGSQQLIQDENHSYMSEHVGGIVCWCVIEKKPISNTCKPCAREEILPDEVKQCPTGQDGAITYSVKKIWYVDTTTKQCAFRIEKTLKSNTCKPKTCPPDEILPDEVRQCPTGQIGRIVYAVKKVFYKDGAQCKFRIEKTVKSNTCAPCAREEILPDEVKQCPTGQVGAITYSVKRIWYPGNPDPDMCHQQCLSRIEKTLKSNTCKPKTCPPDENLPDEVKQCPTGQSGQIVYSVKKVYYLDGTQCKFRIEKSVKSNTCAPCAREEILPDEVKACPTGQSGQIVYSVKKVYYLDGTQCKFRIEKSVKSNTCTACAREEILPDEVKACPTGQSGQIVYSVKKVYYLDGTQCKFRIEKSVKSNTCTACAREEILPDEVKACPTGQSGQIVYSVKKVYYLDGTQCKFRIEKSVKSNTCAPCAREEILPDEVKQCPSGQIGRIVYAVKKVYYLDGSQCKFRIEKSVKSNTCAPCAREEILPDEVKECPAGQVGAITYSVKKIWYPSDPDAHMCHQQCKFRIEKTLKSNTCKPRTCPPNETLADEVRQCPSGQVGRIVYGVKKVFFLEGTQCRFRIEKTLKSNTCAPCARTEHLPDEVKQCPAGQEGAITYSVKRIWYPGNPDAHMCHQQCLSRIEKTLKSNTCRPRVTCTPGVVAMQDYQCGMGILQRVCDGSNDGAGRIVPIWIPHSCYGSPLVFDMDGKGIEAFDPEHSGVKFDMMMNGTKIPVGWVGPNNPFLVYDKNGNGTIDDRGELFGDTGGFANGFDNLAQYDENKDGVFDEHDAVYAKLQLWYDKNQDGVSQFNELVPLSKSVKSINVNENNVMYTIKEQQIRQESTYVHADGATRKIVDIWFQMNPQ